MKKIKKLLDEYHFPGFYPKAAVKGKFGDHKARVIQLVRRQKKLSADAVEWCTGASMTAKPGLSGIYLAVMPGSIWKWKRGELNAGNV